MKYQYATEADTLYIKPQASFLNTSSLSKITDDVKPPRHIERIVFSLQHISKVDAIGLSWLIAKFKKYKALGYQVFLSPNSDTITSAAAFVNLLYLLPIIDDEYQAVI